MMTRIRIVTDSTARFSIPNFQDRYSINIAPMTVRVGPNTIEEYPGLDQARIAALFDDPYDFPICEPPTEETIARHYEKLQSETDQILSIHTSSQISKVVENARSASQRFLGRCDIQVIDSQTMSAGLGLLVQAAAEAAARGADLETLVRILRGMISRLYLVFSVDELPYLEHNHLISRSQSILGEMLGIITFLTIENGNIIPMEKVRTRSRANEKLIEFVSEFASIDHIVILQNHPQIEDDCRILTDRLRSLYPAAPISIEKYGPSVATFVGPKSLGVVVLESEEE
jgi:DegV family protein with EDD domain